MRLTAFTLTQSVCVGDSILAAAQILTPGFPAGCAGRGLGSNPESSF